MFIVLYTVFSILFTVYLDKKVLLSTEGDSVLFIINTVFFLNICFVRVR